MAQEFENPDGYNPDPPEFDPNCPIKSCDSMSASIMCAGALSAVVAVEANVEKEIVGNGYLKSERVKKHCTDLSLILTSDGSGPIYDITIQDQLTDEDLEYMYDINNEAEGVIKYNRSLPPAILLEEIGDEELFISPSNFDPNYDKVKDLNFKFGELTGRTSDNTYQSKKYENNRLSKISKDGSTLVLVHPVLASDDDFVSTLYYDCEISIFKRDNGWNKVHTFNTRQQVGNGYYLNYKTVQSLDINYDGTVIAIGSPYAEVSSAFGGFFANIAYTGVCSVYTYNDVTSNWDAQHLANSYYQFGNSIAIDGDGNTLVIGCTSNFPVRGAVFTLDRNTNTNLFPGTQLNGYTIYRVGNNERLTDYYQRGDTVDSYCSYSKPIVGGSLVCISQDGQVLASYRPVGATSCLTENVDANIEVYRKNISNQWSLSTRDVLDVFGHRNTRGNTDRADIISMSMSQDGNTIAFGACDQHGDDNNNNGLVRTWMYSEVVLGVLPSWSFVDISPDPKMPNINGYSSDLDDIYFGRFVDLSSDGSKLLVGKDKSACLYELSISYYLDTFWSKISEIFPQDRVNKRIQAPENWQYNKKGKYLVTGSLDGEGELVELLSFSDNRFIQQTPRSIFNMYYLYTQESHIQDNHSLYSIDTTKPIDKLNFDTLGTNYLDWNDPTISDFDKDGYKYIFDRPFDLDGTDYNTIITSKLPIYDEFTISFFTKIKDSSSILSHGPINSPQYTIGIRNNQIVISHRNENNRYTYKYIPAFQLNEDWNHVTVSFYLVSNESSYAVVYLNGEILETYWSNSLKGIRPDNTSYSFSINAGEGLDDVRYFSRIITQQEVCRLTQHRLPSNCPHYFYYDFIEENNGLITMEYTSGTFKDVPISEFCNKQVIDDCGNTDCVIDAEITFCYWRDLPFINPIFGVTASGLSGVAFAESNSPPHLQIEQYHEKEAEGIGRIFSNGYVGHSLTQEKFGEAELVTGFVDKYNGEFYDFPCLQKLYPSGDIYTDDFLPSIGNRYQYEMVDEGVYTGDWKTDDGLMSDDQNTYIRLISPDTKGEFFCSLGMTNPLIEPEETVLRMRISGPLKTSDSHIPPRYTIKNIKFADPNGDLIVQYEDIIFTGDSDYDLNLNYTTVVRPAIVNNIVDRYKWQGNYPDLESEKGYSLSFDIVAEDLGGEFTFGYDDSYKEDRFGNFFLNNSLRISAIEICNNGRNCVYDEYYVPLLVQVTDTGRRIEKCFFPSMFPMYDFDSTVWPSVSSVWIANGDTQYSNQTYEGAGKLLEALKDRDPETYIQLDSMGPIENSGKLSLRFGSAVALQKEVTKGAFNSAFNQNINDMWFTPSGAFNTLNKTDIDRDENFFDVDTVTLRVLAKKEVGSRDYTLDIVGYSDDCLLHVTSASGGFLQNTSGVFISDPVADTTTFYGNDIHLEYSASGSKVVGDLGISFESISDEDEYFETDKSNNDGLDHFAIAQYPVVSSTEFEWYEIPLKIYDDRVEVGRSTDYSMSSFLERLYLDIYPLPTGASIASAYLCVRYAPQDAVMLATQGGEKIGRISNGRSEGGFYPTTRQSDSDIIINAGSGYGPLSKIENIPHAFGTPSGVKSNYSRRWRGMEGTRLSPFGTAFNLGYTNAMLDYPFLSGFYLFEESSTTITPVVGNLEGTLTTNYSDYHHSHFGWRFLNNDLFSSQMPGYTTDYKTTDWTALTDGVNTFEDHELYGRIADAFKNVVRISGHNSYINFGDVDIVQGSGFSVYVRFTPDISVSGNDYNLFDSGVLVSKWDTASDLEFALAYSGGYLAGFAKDEGGTVHEVVDTVPYSGYQYPLSVILTYNDKASRTLKLYTDNEFESEWDTLRATSNEFDLAIGDSDLIVGHSPGSGVGMSMFLSEFGLSNSGNLVYQDPVPESLEVAASQFLENNRVYWWDGSDSPSSDAYRLWSNLDEDTYNDWYLGAYNRCAFNREFDGLNSIKGKSSGRDLVNFTINHHGSGYSQYVEKEMPLNIDSGVSYHTQIENDFLRFNLSDTADNFYSVYPRIRKSLPNGYDFTEKALVVESILEHTTNTQNIVWEDGNVGPKLIVSLYTKTKEPEYLKTFVPEFAEPNWGLINRDIHYLEPSSCLIRVDSKFTYDSYCDESEEWALFPHHARFSDFKEKYYSKDVDDMFLQYDLVYPSGPPYHSRIDIHSAHVRAENAFIEATSVSGDMTLTTSGNPSPVSGQLNLNLLSASGHNPRSSELYPNLSGITLMTLGPLQVQDSGFILFTSGEKTRTETLPVFVIGKETIQDSGFTLVASGDDRTWTSVSAGGSNPVGASYSDFVVGQNQSPGLSLYTFGKGLVSGIMPLTLGNYESGVPVSGFNMPLFTFGPSGDGFIAMRETAPMFLLQNTPGRGDQSGVASLVTAGSQVANSPYISNSMPLFTFAPNILQETFNLTIFGHDFATTTNTTLPFFLANYLDSDVLPLLWNNYKYGTDIELEDNSYASIPANDEIRGVDLFGYGACDSDSPKKANDVALVTDDTVWRPETCNEGGIFRATATYTNLDVGYSGHYYGIRKYTNLTPSAPYFVTLEITTGSTEPIKVPRDWEEWEYGICGPDTIGDCCPDDCTQNIHYSGIKLLGDYPYVVGDEDLTQVVSRQQENEYGRSTSVKEDLMAVGSPYHTLVDERGDDIENAGSVFLYRRAADVPGLKASWLFEDKLMLPSGYRKDYIRNVYQNLLCYPNRGNPEFCISGQKWSIGQEGREFGYSLDIGYNDERETVVVGAPGAAWNRSFENINVSGIPALMVVFTDKFSYNKKQMSAIHNTAAKYERLYKYFSAPWDLGGGEFQPRLDINLLVCQIIDADQRDTTFPVNASEPWFHHMYVGNLLEKIEGMTPEDSYQLLLNEATSGIEEKFRSIFPHDDQKIYSGIPPIVGIFGDDTASTSDKATFEGALNGFVNFYQDYAYSSGVENLQENTAQSGYVNKIFSDSFVWNEASVEILDKTLATGNLIENDSLIYVTSGVGQQWAKSGAYEFQIPPESGGRVFVFEKENDKFNLIQEIISPEEDLVEEENMNRDADEAVVFYGQRHNDRFGHAVSISENSEVIAVGSPYSVEPCIIYERDETENERLYKKVGQWLDLRLTSQKERYNTLLAASGAIAAGKQIYLELDQPNKFLIRTDELFWGHGQTIKPYKKVFKYGNNDIDYVGTWSFLPFEFAGMSRLGFSAAVSESGNTVAFGAPTDSFNEFDDFNVWGESEDTWASYAQAGAVRVFESRDYSKHNKVVEYSRFGNLDRNTNGPHPSYESMGEFFSPLGVSFERLPFAEIEIPRDAGLAFIITPEIDSASDEIIDNIKTWLSYGDRTLVLVGNDPVWEQNGLYEQSNEIINKILKKLDCRMRIVPARNRSEALHLGVSYEDYLDDRVNVTRAHRPQYGHEVYTSSPNLFASGVADIRIDLSDLDLEDLKIYSPCDDKNARCELPIEHLGDLRAEWESECVVLPNGGVEYKTNWPFHFDNPNPAQSCTFYPEIVKPQIPNKEYQDIVPILTAAEYKQRPPIIIPADSGIDEQCTTELSGVITTVIRRDTKTYEFADFQLDNVEFAIGQEPGTKNLTGVFNNFERDNFFDPDAFKDRNAFMQSAGTSYAVDAPPETVVVSPESVWATEEQYFNDATATTSKVILMASMQAETDWSFGKSPDISKNPNNNDQNIYFFNNLVSRDCNNAGNIDQLGGWTGRTSFKDALADSRVEKILKMFGHDVRLNVEYSGDIPSSTSVLWIANPSSKPSETDIARIKKWLRQGDKKVVITYSPDQEIANHVEYICDELSLNTKPYYSQGNNAYFVKDSDKIARSNSQNIPYQPGEEIAQLIDEEAQVFKGCATGYSFNYISSNTKVEKLAIIPEAASPDSYEINEYDFETGLTDYAYIPIKVGANTRKLVYYLDPLTEQRYTNPYIYWKIDSDSNIKFPVTPGSGYRMFVNWVSETRDEKFDITVDVNGVNFSAYPDGEGSEFTEQGGNRKLNKTVVNEPRVHQFDFRVPSGIEEFTVNFNTKEWRTIKSEEFDGGRPLTPRILSISGCLLPIDVTTEVYERVIKRNVYITKCSGVPWYVPERTITFPETFRPISTSNDKYCNPQGDICDGFGGQDIEDGPVVVADELEHFTDFSRGVRRSRIILITDSSIIQGDNPFRDDANEGNQEFIRSLYPLSPEKINREQSSEESNVLEGFRKFEFTQKLRAPEKGSAAKYYAATGIQNQTIRYTLGGVAGNLTNYTDQEDTYDPNKVTRRFTPETLEKIKTEIKNFGTNNVPDYGMFPRYSGIIDGTLFIDSNIAGGMPDFMKVYGKDYIEFDMLASGYAGDLFGYSVDIHEDKLVVGAPFNAFKGSKPVSWSGIKEAYDEGEVGSGLQLSAQGGAGAAFYFERTGRGTNAVSEFLPWQFKQKIKPDSVNAGIDNCTLTELKNQRAHEPVSLTPAFVLENAAIPDRFGYSVSIDSDFVAIGAPMHDFETVHEHIYSGTIDPNGLNTAFIRKEFGKDFDIPQHKYYDLGSSGVRIDQLETESGKMVLNNGAVYTFRHQMTSFGTRSKEWIFAEKLNAQGYSDRNTDLSLLGGNENDHFGFSVAIDRAYRGDSDYTLVAGSPRHDYATSGDHPTSTLNNAGSVYTFDAMLREQNPSIPVSGNYIDAQVFGLRTPDREAMLSLVVEQNISGSPISYSVSGQIYSNPNGDIFLEVSGRDPATKGFTSHRPYVASVTGDIIDATGVNSNVNLVTRGRGIFVDNAWPSLTSPLDIGSDYDFNRNQFDDNFDSAKIRPSGMSLFIVAPDQADVYNNMNLYTTSWTTIQEGSGVGATPFLLNVDGTEPTIVSGIPTLYTSGIGAINDQLNLRVRGV